MDTFGGKIYKIRQKWTQSDENRQNRRKMETIGEKWTMQQIKAMHHMLERINVPVD